MNGLTAIICVLLVTVDNDLTAKMLLKIIPMVLMATAAVILKLMVEGKKKKITFWNALLSWVAAVSVSYLVYDWAVSNFQPWAVPPIIAFFVMCGDKITTYFVDKFNVDTIITALINWLLEKAGINKK